MKKRDIGQEILEGVRAIKEGKGRRIKVELPSDVKKIREDLHLTGHNGLVGSAIIINLKG